MNQHAAEITCVSAELIPARGFGPRTALDREGGAAREQSGMKRRWSADCDGAAGRAPAC